MSKISRIEPSELFSEATVWNGLVSVSGQVTLKNKGSSIEKKTVEVLGRIDQFLYAANSSKENILSASVILSDQEDFRNFNEVWRGWLKPGSAPARTTWIAALTSDDFKIEVSAVAATRSGEATLE